MGLAFSHCDARWSHSGFHRFRRRVAREIGMDLDAMNGFANGHLPWTHVADPIALLLNHSDCDGELSPEECAHVWPRLLVLIESWPAEDYDTAQAVKLADGMKRAAEKGEALRFR